MKIAVAIPSREISGGVALAQWTFASSLRVRGHDVRCLVPTARWMMLLHRFVPSKLRDFFVDMRAPAQAKVFGPQFVITADWYSLWHKRHVGIPVFHGGDGMTLRYAPPPSWLGRLKTSLLWWLQRKAAARAPFFIAVSQEALEMFGLPNGHVCLNATDLDRLRPVSGQEKADAKIRQNLEGDVVLIAGRWSPEKRLESIWDLPQQMGRRLLVCIPDPAEAERFADLCVGRDDILVRSYAKGIPDDIWSATDCVYMPSRYEGCSMLWIEAAARGIPVVGTKVGHLIDLAKQHPELEDLLMPRDDLSCAAEKIETALAHGNAWCKAMRGYAEQHHSIHMLGARLEAVLQKVKIPSQYK